jgi:hypothetical protein
VLIATLGVPIRQATQPHPKLREQGEAPRIAGRAGFAWGFSKLARFQRNLPQIVSQADLRLALSWQAPTGAQSRWIDQIVTKVKAWLTIAQTRRDFHWPNEAVCCRNPIAHAVAIVDPSRDSWR